MHALVEKLATAGASRVRSPLTIVPWPPAMSVARADIHQRTQAAFGHDLLRSLKRRMKSMIESDSQYPARAICLLLQGSQLGGATATWLLQEDMLTPFERCQRAGNESVVGRRHDDRVDIGTPDEGCRVALDACAMHIGEAVSGI